MSAAQVAMLQRLALGGLGAASLVLLLRKRSAQSAGQYFVSLPPFLVGVNGDLVSIQHTYSSPEGVKVLLIPMLPIAQKSFYDDVVQALTAENALVLEEGVQAEGFGGAAEAQEVTPETADGYQEFDHEFADQRPPGTEWRDYGDEKPRPSSAASPMEAPGRRAGGEAAVAHQGYFHTQVNSMCSTLLADTLPNAAQWRLSTIFEFRPLEPDRKDRLLQHIIEQSRAMQYGGMSGGAWDNTNSNTKFTPAGRGSPPDCLAVPWAAGACPAIDAALQGHGFTLVSKTHRTLLDALAFRRLYRLRAVSDTTAASILSKLFRV